MRERGRNGDRLLIDSAKKTLIKSMFQKKIVYLHNLLDEVSYVKDAAIQRVTTNYNIWLIKTIRKKQQ